MTPLDRKIRYELRWYSGYRGQERPQALVAGEKEKKIEKILSRKRRIDLESGEMCEEFQCKIEGDIVIIKLFPSGKWILSFTE